MKPAPCDALGLAVARYEYRNGQEAPAPERPAQPLRLSTGYLVPVPAPRPAGGLRIRGIVLGESGPVAGARVTATRPEPGQTLSALTCEALLGPRGSGEPLAECWREATPALLELVQARQGEAPIYAETTTAGDGGFSLEALPEGTFALWASDGRGVVLRQDVAAGTEGVELELGEGLILRGQVRGEREVVALGRPRRLQGRVMSEGVPAPDAEVRVVESMGGQTLRAVVRTDAQGHFSVEALRPGYHDLLASRGERRANLLVDLGEPRPEVVLELDTGAPAFRGLSRMSGTVLFTPPR